MKNPNTQHLMHHFTLKLRLVMLYQTFLFLLTGNMKHLFFTVKGGLTFSVDEMSKSSAKFWVISKREDDPNLHQYNITQDRFTRSLYQYRENQ